ncbi:MAG: type VI secretion protein IcmF [Legionella sp.]|nr:type VI secretion protein IcmF [Legionella sp.]
MTHSLDTLCKALKNIFGYLKPQTNPISFVILTGKAAQGKTTFLRQTGLLSYSDSGLEDTPFFYNQEGVILELGEKWINASKYLLTDVLKRLNQCHKAVKITGVLLCVDSNELLSIAPNNPLEITKAHAAWLSRFCLGIGYAVDTAIILTKLDALSGFCEFFQHDHAHELAKPLGFSLETHAPKNKRLNRYRQSFDQLIESLGQQSIHKLHPVRSRLQRTLIREFPLQLTSLRAPIQSLVQYLPSSTLRLRAIYFTSAEQGGLNTNHLSKKISKEYHLTVPEFSPHSHNEQAYFIQGIIRAFQKQTKPAIKRLNRLQKAVVGAGVSCFAITLSWLWQNHQATSKHLEQVNQELGHYRNLRLQNDSQVTALYHLYEAHQHLQIIHMPLLAIPLINALKSEFTDTAQQLLRNSFFPILLTTLEKNIADTTQTPSQRYQALKTYLLLGDPKPEAAAAVVAWFSDYWKTHYPPHQHEQYMRVLKECVAHPLPSLRLDQQLVLDTRNYLNALPTSYLYYQLAKSKLSKSTQPLLAEGFDLSKQNIPSYYTRGGFKKTCEDLAKIAAEQQRENWVLARQDLADLPTQIRQAYCLDYVNWWQRFIQTTRLAHSQDLTQVDQLLKTIAQTKSMTKLIRIIQNNTKPEPNQSATLFNQKIASEFLPLNLISMTQVSELNDAVNELEQLLATLSLVQDEGRASFQLTKARFLEKDHADPLSRLYTKIRPMPEPIAGWVKQIADETWSLLITNGKHYLNHEWRTQIYEPYAATLAKHYPLDPTQTAEISLDHFDQFFAPHGLLNRFVNDYLTPFLDRSTPQWQPKAINGYVMPIASELTNELMRANVITNMFFAGNDTHSQVRFSLQKINLDPTIAQLQLSLGKTILNDNQSNQSITQFNWPDAGAKLRVDAVDGHNYALEENGPWAFFRILEKLNILVDSEDSASLQILFNINGNSGRYVLKTQNQINPFSPGILAGFRLSDNVA